MTKIVLDCYGGVKGFHHTAFGFFLGERSTAAVRTAPVEPAETKNSKRRA